MAVSAPSTATPNDSGIVLVLFCMMAALAYAVVSAVSLFAAATHNRVRLLSGWANVGNACVHAFLILLLIVDQGGISMFVSELISKPTIDSISYTFILFSVCSVTEQTLNSIT